MYCNLTKKFYLQFWNAQKAKNIFMTIFIVHWPCLLTTKLSCLQKNNWGLAIFQWLVIMLSSGRQLWKLDVTKLKNRANVRISNESIFESVLGSSFNNNLTIFNGTNNMWIKGTPTSDGYFTLTNHGKSFLGPQSKSVGFLNEYYMANYASGSLLTAVDHLTLEGKQYFCLVFTIKFLNQKFLWIVSAAFTT